MTNFLAEELRQTLGELDADPNSTHLEPITRERLVRLTEQVERLGTEETASGLEPEQEIRARAAEIVLGSQEYHVGAQRMLDEIDALAAYIRDGSKP